MANSSILAWRIPWTEESGGPMGSQTVVHDRAHTNRWKHTPRFWTGRINMVKVSILSKVIHRFKATPIKLLMAFFADLEQKIFTRY